ncbi:MAG: type VII toxin-antitoxin system MntA family adenylyltransferase antitoxin [Candidatus Methanospirareceae archaeon]
MKIGGRMGIETKEVEDYIERIAGEIEGVLNRFQEIEFAYLFGSFIDIERDVFRDIDVAVYVSSVSPFSAYEKMKLSLKIGRELEKVIRPRCEFDVKILNYAPILFQYEVIKTGKVVFSRDEVDRIRYEAKVISSYLDYKETSDWLDSEFLAGL